MCNISFLGCPKNDKYSMATPFDAQISKLPMAKEEEAIDLDWEGNTA